MVVLYCTKPLAVCQTDIIRHELSFHHEYLCFGIQWVGCLHIDNIGFNAETVSIVLVNPFFKLASVG